MRAKVIIFPFFDLTVAFGTVLEGMDLVDRICSLPVDSEGHPLQSISIADCGELPVSNAHTSGNGIFLLGQPLSNLFRWIFGESQRDSKKESGPAGTT